MLLNLPFNPPMAPEDEKLVRNRIDRAKIRLMEEKGTTFFSALLANLRLCIDRTHATAATDAVSLWINPDMVYKLPEEEVLGIMLHEVMHVAGEHCDMEIYGKPEYNQYVLGIAMDEWINNLITGMGYTIPSFGYCTPKYIGWPTMKIYHDLMKNGKAKEQPLGWKPDVLGKPADMSDEEYKNRIESNLIKAAIQAEMANDAGSIPAHLRLKIEKLVSPELPWNLILYKYMDQYAKEDYSYTRPNKRFLPEWYLPSMHSEGLEGVVSGIDVSGSMMDEIAEVMAENRYVKELINPQWFHLMTWDTEVHHDQVYESYDELPDEEIPDGGAGGTVIEPLIKLIREKQPRFALIFSDGYFDEPSMKGIKSDIYWIITKKGDPKFRAPHGVGTVIRMN